MILFWLACGQWRKVQHGSAKGRFSLESKDRFDAHRRRPVALLAGDEAPEIDGAGAPWRRAGGRAAEIALTLTKSQNWHFSSLRACLRSSFCPQEVTVCSTGFSRTAELLAA